VALTSWALCRLNDDNFVQRNLYEVVVTVFADAEFTSVMGDYSLVKFSD